MEHLTEFKTPEPNKLDPKILKVLWGNCRTLSESHSLKIFIRMSKIQKN